MNHMLEISFDTEGMTKQQQIRRELEIERVAGAVSTGGGWHNTCRVLHFLRWPLEEAQKVGARVKKAQPKKVPMMIRVSKVEMEQPAWA